MEEVGIDVPFCFMAEIKVIGHGPDETEADGVGPGRRSISLFETAKEVG